LRRTNAETTTPVDKTDKLLQRLIKEGYIVKIKDNTSGEEMIEYKVGPRGMVEVGKEGVANFVRSVYGGEVDDLEKRLDRSLALGNSTAPASVPLTSGASGATAEGAGRRRSRRRNQDDDEEESEDESEDE